MSKTITGIYREGRVELQEVPRDVGEETRVLVIFPEPRSVDLASRGIDEGQAADLRARLSTIADDWETPEMDAYDDYDNARAKLLPR